MFMKKLTKSQAKVFDFLKESIADGITPSVREICLATGLSSTSTVHSHLKSLEELGYITRTTGLNRSIRIVGEEKSITGSSHWQGYCRCSYSCF